MAERTCTHCGKPAVCVYGIGQDEQVHACASHDPMNAPGWPSRVLPEGFHYQTLPGFTTTMAARPLHPHIVITNDGAGP